MSTAMKRQKASTPRKKQHFTVFVLGEIGRSPRMQYHALSLANMNKNKNDPTTTTTVDLVGFNGPPPHQAILSHPNIHVSGMDTYWYNWTQPLMRKHFLLFLVFAPVKLLIQWMCILGHLLFCMSSASAAAEENVVLVQNPPAIPTLVLIPFYLMILRLFSFLTFQRNKKYRLVVDWHNYAHTLMVNVSGADQGSGNGEAPPRRLGFLKKCVLSVATFLEVKCAKWFADAHLCVSKAMQKDLKERFQIDATVHYDRPPQSVFKRQQLTLDEQHELYGRVFGYCDAVDGDDMEETLFTLRNKSTGHAVLKDDRPALVVSSTSWTPDEDFSILLKAVELYDQKQTEKKHKCLQLIITGSGPLKAYYQAKIREMDLKYCTIDTKWLEAEDYPKLLSCCDLGVCLHYSSSGVDLPMKVVDMFGSGVPVCAINFEALPELVQDKKNGYIFSGSQQLADQLYELFVEDKGNTKLKNMKANILEHFHKRDWDIEWNEKVRPIMTQQDPLKEQ